MPTGSRRLVDEKGGLFGDDSFLLIYCLSEVFGEGEKTLVGEPIVEPEASFHSGGNPMGYLLWSKVERIQFLGGGSKSPRATEAGDMGLIGENQSKHRF